jgi:hypothetical protein
MNDLWRISKYYTDEVCYLDRVGYAYNRWELWIRFYERIETDFIGQVITWKLGWDVLGTT